MMKKYFQIMVFFLLPVLPAAAQRDPKADELLQALSEKMEQAPSVQLTFTLVTEDLMEGTTDTITGELSLKGTKYRMKLPEQWIFFDGSTVGQYLTDVEEITLSHPDPEDDSFFSNPQKLFTLYREDYKTRYIGRKETLDVVDLYPGDLSEDYSRIRLHINADVSLKEAEYRLKSGLVHHLLVGSMSLNKELPDEHLSLNPAEFPAAEVIDLR